MALRVFSFWLLLLSTTLAQTPPVGTASLSGKVTIEGKPAPGITVRLQKSDEQWEPNKPPTTVTTDSNGVFKFDRLPAAQYVVTPSAPGYYNPQKKNEWQEGITINLADGEQASGQDFALQRGAVVTGRLFDANGRAIIEQQVVLKRIGGKHQPQTMQCTERSDDRGVYRCYGLEPGKYIVGAGNDPKEDNVMMIGAQSYVRVWYPGVAQEEQAAPVEVTIEKEASGIDLKLERKKKGFKVMGRVVDADTSKPVPNIMIALGAVNEEGLTYSYAIGSGGGASNAEGEFKLEGITKGKYQLIPQPYGITEYVGEPVTFEADNEDVTGLEIKMRKGATIQGAAVLEEGATPEAQRKLVGVNLVAQARDPKTKETDWYGITNSWSGIDAAGNVQFKGVRTGNVTINLTGKEAKGFSIRRVERDGAPITDGLQVNAGEAITGLRIVLALGSGTIRGEIKVEGGTLPEDVGLRLRAKTTNKTQGDGWGNIDARGKFLIENLNSGTYELVVETFMNRPPYGKPSVTLQANSKTVQVTNGQEQTVNLTVTIGSTSKEGKQ